MTRRIFSFDPPDRFVCGAVGQPGRRTFFLQASRGSQVVSVALEKAQVAVLAERLGLLLLALRERGLKLTDDELLAQEATARPLLEPVVEEFRVGTLTLAWDAERERVIIEARELTGDEDDESETAETLEAQAAEAQALEAQAAESELSSYPADDGPEGPDLVRVHLEPAEAQAFVTGAVAVVQAGRPPCPQCGAPLEPTGHFCPRRNGYTH